MTYSISLNVAALKAVALAKAVQDIRYYLNGVLLESDDKGNLFIVATDGHRMHATRTTSAHMPPKKQIILPADLVDAVKPGRKTPETVRLELDDDLLGGVLEMDQMVMKFKAQDGQFPDWRRILPRTASADGVGTSVNPAYLTDVAKAGKLLGAGALPRLDFAGPSGVVRALLPDVPDFVAAIMPLRWKATDVFALPSWC